MLIVLKERGCLFMVLSFGRTWWGHGFIGRPFSEQRGLWAHAQFSFAIRGPEDCRARLSLPSRAMQVLPTKVDRGGEDFESNRQVMLGKLAEFEQLQSQARLGGGQKYIDRHRARGKLLVRERIESLVDRDTPFLELSTLAAWGTDKNLGANAVTGIGVVSGIECIISANDPTSQAGLVEPIQPRQDPPRSGHRNGEPPSV